MSGPAAPLAIVKGAPNTTPPSPTLIIQAGGSPGLAGAPAAQEIVGIREGMPPVGAILFWYEFGSQGGTLDVANCRMRVGIAPRNNYVCPVTSNGVTVGSWTVSAGQTNGALVISKVGYSTGDDLQVIGPSITDPDLNDTLIIMALEPPPPEG